MRGSVDLEKGVTFGVRRLVSGICRFSGHDSADNPSRPHRSQKSLLEVSRMSKRQHYGAKMPSAREMFLIWSKAFWFGKFSLFMRNTRAHAILIARGAPDLEHFG